ncbi:M16 family metallopeptidase [Nakamurella endophytica]|uniref:Peptidase M16 n=1 Tax=Nakamurella endophytica TaxID=1748367 RepID=A0A917STG8_9ACTN|nr:pitrilysin family protein [Nakamurella endophytica]GGL95439.1 peptidase M16 [Nakamurella endophytica]
MLETGEGVSGGSQVTMSVLPGGVRVVTESVPGARSASVGVWVGVGSIDETPALAGCSHFLEHLLFKGTRHRTGHEIAAAVDAVGGEFNAFTSHEYTCYYAHVLASAAELAVDLVCDVVLDAVVSAADVDVERSVILEELAMREDDPEDTLGDAFAAAAFAGHPVADPVIGTEDTVTAMSRTQVAGYYRRRYQPDRMVVAVAGGIDHSDVVRWVRRAFGSRTDPAVQPRAPRGAGGRLRAPQELLVVERDIEQAHLCVGVRALPRTDPRRHTLAVVSGVLGGGMSSRLFRTIREERGLAYSCYTATSAYADVGSLSVYAGCQPENLGTVAALVGEELQRLADDGVGADELRRVQGQLTGSYLLGLEDTESRMSRIGKNLLVRSDFRTVAQDLAAIEAVTADDVVALTRELLAGPLTGAVVGPYSRRDQLPGQLQELTGRPAARPRVAAHAERRRRHVR